MPRTTSSSSMSRRVTLYVVITLSILLIMFVELMCRNGAYRRTLQEHCNHLLAQGNTRGFDQDCPSLAFAEYKPSTTAATTSEISRFGTIVAPAVNAAINVVNGLGLMLYALNIRQPHAQPQLNNMPFPVAPNLRSPITQRTLKTVANGEGASTEINDSEISVRNVAIGDGTRRLNNPMILNGQLVFEDDVSYKLFLGSCSSLGCSVSNITDTLVGGLYFNPKLFKLTTNMLGIVYEGSPSEVWYAEIDTSVSPVQRTFGPVRVNPVATGFQGDVTAAFDDVSGSGCILWSEQGTGQMKTSSFVPGSQPVFQQIVYTITGSEADFSISRTNSALAPYVITWQRSGPSQVMLQALNSNCGAVGLPIPVSSADGSTHRFPISTLTTAGNTIAWVKNGITITSVNRALDGTISAAEHTLPTASITARIPSYQIMSLNSSPVPGTDLTAFICDVKNNANGIQAPYLTVSNSNGDVYLRFYAVDTTASTTAMHSVVSVDASKTIHNGWTSKTTPAATNSKIEYAEIPAGPIFDDHGQSSATVIEIDPKIPFNQNAQRSLVDYCDLGATQDFQSVTVEFFDLQDNPLPDHQFVSVNATGDAIPATAGGENITPYDLRTKHSGIYPKPPNYDLRPYKLVFKAETVDGNAAPPHEETVNIQAQDFLPECRVPAAYINLVEGRTARIPFGDFCSYPNKNMAPSTADSPAIRITGFDGLKLPAGCRVEGTTLVCDKVTAATIKDSGLTVQINMERVFNGTQMSSFERVTLRRVPAPSSKKNKVAAIAGGSVGALCVISTTAAVGAALFNKAKKKSNGRNFGAERDDVKARLGAELFEHYELCTFIAKELVATLKITHERLNVTKDAYNQTSPFGEVIAKVYEMVRALHNAGEIDFVNQNKRYRLLNDDKLPIERLKKIGAKLAKSLTAKYPDLIKAEKQRYTKDLIDNVAGAFIRDIQGGWKDKTKWKKEFTFGGINTETMQPHDMVMLPPVISTSFAAPESHFAMPSSPIDMTEHTEQYEQQGSDGSPPGAGKAAAASASHGSPAGAGVFGVRQTGTAGFKLQQGGAARDEEMGMGNNGDEPGVELQGIRLDFVNSGRRVTHG